MAKNREKRAYKKKTTEEKLLALTPKVIKFIEGTVNGKILKPSPTRVSVCKLILGIQLDKDKREGKSTSSYESQLMGQRKDKKK